MAALTRRRGRGLPPRFTAALCRALAHYGIDSLERTAALEEACYRLFLSKQRAEIARTAIVAILDRRLEDADELVGHVDDEEFREVLDRLAIALEGRDPVVADLAREVRFRYFDEPVIAEARERVYAEIERAGRGARRASPSDRTRGADRGDSRLPPSARAATDGRDGLGHHRPLAGCSIEAMTRRYYRTRSLAGFEHLRAGRRMTSRCAATRSTGSSRQLATAYVELEDVTAIADAFARHAATLPGGEPRGARPVRAAPRPSAGARGDSRARLSAALAEVPTPPALHRIVVAVAEPRRGRGMSAIDLFTFRPGPSGLVEDKVLRGLHPMMGHRLQLWRLREFDLERLASPEDIYMFHGVARANAEGRAVVRAGRGPRPHRRPRRTGSRRRAAGARTGAGVGTRGDPRLSGAPAHCTGA